MEKNLLNGLIAAGPGFLFFLLGLIIYIVQHRRQKHMTARTTGHVIRYSYLGNGNVAPVAAYTVDGKEYKVRRKFRSIVTKSVTTSPVPTVRDSGAYVTDKDVLVLHTGNVTDLEAMMQELWPIGKPVTVFYDPEKPKRARMEKLQHLPCVVSVIYFWLGGALAVLGAVLGFLLF